MLLSLVFGLIVFLIILEYVLPLLMRKMMVPFLRRKCKGKLFLTYDDGPGPDLESRLIKILNKHGAKATFFLNGLRAESFPDRCDLLMESGHEVGCHCYAHLNPYTTPPWEVLADIRKAYRVLARWIWRDRLFRPPYGRLTGSLSFYLMVRDVRMVFWTVDSRDTYLKLPRQESIVKKVVEEGGAVVLMHSFDREPPTSAERSEYVLSLTESLLNAAKENGLRVCTINELT